MKGNRNSYTETTQETPPVYATHHLHRNLFLLLFFLRPVMLCHEFFNLSGEVDFVFESRNVGVSEN